MINHPWNVRSGLEETSVKRNQGKYGVLHGQTAKEIRDTAGDWQVGFESIRDPIMILDEHFGIIRANASAAAFFEKSCHELRSFNCFHLMHHAGEPVHGCPLSAALHSKGHEEAEYFDESRNRWLFVSVDPILNDKAGLIRFIHIMKDITADKQAEEEKRRLEVQRVQSQKMEALGTMAAGIAHDFNNVLQPILINSELISDMLSADSTEREYLDQIMEAARLGKNLVRQIKFFDAKKKKEHQAIVMSAVVEDALNFFRQNHLPGGISFRQWITDRDSLVQVDAAQVYQLIVNLCMNAVQSMKTGRGFLGVSLRKTLITAHQPAMISDIRPGWYEKLTVRDTGCGIEQDIMPHIFDPFFTTRNPGKGTGLGLAMVHEVTKNIGGSIVISSIVGKGTRFEVYFPVRHADRAPARLQVCTPARTGNEKHILLVDDNMADLRSIHQLLLHLGHRVDSTSNPAEALDIFRDDPSGFDMLITDQIMPAMRGHTLAMQVHRIRKDIPVIICSGSEDILLELKEREKEIGEFILKPFTRTQLVEAMDRLFSTAMQS
jgi:PAS domain S-box-containing protein